MLTEQWRQKEKKKRKKETSHIIQSIILAGTVVTGFSPWDSDGSAMQCNPLGPPAGRQRGLVDGGG